MTLAGLNATQLNPAGDDVCPRVTEPANPLRAVTVTVELMLEPGVPEGEVPAMLKSVTVNVAVVECESVPLVPVIVSV